MKKPANAIKWTNGMVMVFDVFGERIPELQGPYEEVKDRVLEAAGDHTKFQHGEWEKSIEEVDRINW